MVRDEPRGLHYLLDEYPGDSSTGVGGTRVQTNDSARTEFVQPGESYTVRGSSTVDNDEVIAHALQEELSHLAAKEAAEGNDSARTEFVQPGESYTVRASSTVDNDEVIAHALQEELSHLAAKEAAGGSEKSQESWPGLSSDPWSAEGVAHNDYDPTTNRDHDSGQDSEDEGVPEISEYLATYDGEVGKRLNHMDSIPHIPKINGEIPTVDDASAAHQRLFDRLKRYGLSELKMDGDGNCQFRAFSDQLYRTPTHHKSVREDVVTQLTSHPEIYEGYVLMKYNDYVKQMAKSGEWGDHVTLQAAADYYGVKICLLTSFKDTSLVEIVPRETKSKRVICLSFWSEVHYNSIYADGD